MSRFWISVESLNRPPTLLTMASSFKSSSMLTPFELSDQDRVNVRDRFFQIVVDYLKIELAGAVHFLLGGGEPALDGGLALSAPAPEPCLQRCQRRRAKKYRHVIGALPPHLLGALHVDVEQYASTFPAKRFDFTYERSVIVAVHLRVLERPCCNSLSRWSRDQK